MKLTKFKLSLSLLLTSLSLIATLSTNVCLSYAQGTCTCRASFPVCLVDNDSCEENYVAVCPNIDVCNENACECQNEIPGINCSTSGQSCINKQCCETQNLTCNLSQCVALPTPIPSEAAVAEITPFQVITCQIPCSDYPDCYSEGIETALGCIPIAPGEFIGRFREILIGIGSGIALLMMVVGSFFVLTSQGQPEKLSRGKEVFIGGLVGLLIMIFSIFLLSFIGVDLLGLFRQTTT